MNVVSRLSGADGLEVVLDRMESETAMVAVAQPLLWVLRLMSTSN